MQLFYLFSFVVVVSYAAALPRPAEISEEHSNSVDITLMSLFETRSYQSVLNTRDNSVTLVSLERRANSGRSSGGNSGGSGTPPSPASTFEKAKNTIDTVFGKGAFNCGKLSATIDNVGDGIFRLPDDIRKVLDKIGGIFGRILETYFRRALYVKTVLEGWVSNPEENIISIIKSGLGVLEYSKIDLFLRQTAEMLTYRIQGGLRGAMQAVMYLLKNIGFTDENVEMVHESFETIFLGYMTFFDELKSLLMKFPSGKVFHKYISDICKSLDKFIADQEGIYGKFEKAFEAFSSEY
ncbi:hypothetical protein BASA81_013909 [Batrachochytrium salamandrivorans]|nr:hypothetical protein BASA81_013909 [Batrachochytrium salamandrivorans]